MASVQDEAPIKEGTDDQAEKPVQETSADEGIKPAMTNEEEAEVVVHDDEDEEQEQEEIHNEVKEEDNIDDKENFAGSPLIGNEEDEPTATFDEEGETEIEEGDLI